MLKVGLSALAASSLLTTAALAHSVSDTSSFEEISSFVQLKEMCYRLRANRQLPEPNSVINCNQERRYWVKVREEVLPLRSENVVRISADIKSGAHSVQSWWQVVPNQENFARCDVMQERVARASVSTPFTSCEQLDSIADETAFCQERLAQAWEAGAFVEEATGLERGCQGQMAPMPAPLTTTSSISIQAAEPLTTTSSCEAPAAPLVHEEITTTSSFEEPMGVFAQEPLTTTSSLEAPVLAGGCAPQPGMPMQQQMPMQYAYGQVAYQETPNRIKYLPAQRGVRLIKDPPANSVLGKAQMKKGYVIRAINGHHVDDQASFDREMQKALAKSQKSGKNSIKVEYRASEQMKFTTEKLPI